MARPARRGHLDAAGSEVGEATGFPASDNLKLCDWGGDAATQKRAFDPFYTQLVFTHRRGGESYTVARSELADAVGGLESVEGLPLAQEYLRSQEDALCA